MSQPDQKTSRAAAARGDACWGEFAYTMVRHTLISLAANFFYVVVIFFRHDHALICFM